MASSDPSLTAGGEGTTFQLPGGAKYGRDPPCGLLQQSRKWTNIAADLGWEFMLSSQHSLAPPWER